MTHRQCRPVRLDHDVNQDPRLIFEARLVFKARLVFEQIRYTFQIMESQFTSLTQRYHMSSSDHSDDTIVNFWFFFHLLFFVSHAVDY